MWSVKINFLKHSKFKYQRNFPIQHHYQIISHYLQEDMVLHPMVNIVLALYFEGWGVGCVWSAEITHQFSS